ncbi:MAG: carboxypeptidase-like regulatory domain-containing protein [Flavobacteriales bacterium]|nr:carboxypeptidase-like regulatory domain-containing protein [Flavobacteriales bacterium]
MRLVLPLLLLPIGLSAQTTITGRVLDANTREPMPYVSIGIVGADRGTLSNEEGTFSMAADTLRSTLQFSTIGYKTRVIGAAEVARNGVVLLYPTARELPSFVVKSNDALYERVALVAKALKHRTPEKARAYFELETHVEQQPVEVVECFYNAELSGAQVRELRLKHGRISLAPFQSTPGSERYFVSLNTTKAVTLFDLTGSDERFPVSPLQWTKAKAVKKHYRAELVATDEEGTDEILLTPRDSSGNSFTVNLWLRGDRLLAVELNCAKCIRHPFLPYQPEHTIRQVDLRIRQTWRTDAAQLDHIELAYTLDYLNNEHAERVDTRAVLHLFDPGGAFILPLFDYDQEQPDYRKILLQPYDSVFWERAPTLVSTAQQERDRAFLRTNGVFSGHRVDKDHARSSFFESNCAWWSADKRISLKSLPPPAEVARPASSELARSQHPLPK